MEEFPFNPLQYLLLYFSVHLSCIFDFVNDDFRWKKKYVKCTRRHTKYRKWVLMRNRQYVVRTVCVYDAEWSVSLSHYWDVSHGPFFRLSSVSTHIEQYSTRATRTHAIIHIQANYNKFSAGFYFLFRSVTFPFQTTIKWEMHSDRARSGI